MPADTRGDTSDSHFMATSSFADYYVRILVESQCPPKGVLRRRTCLLHPLPLRCGTPNLILWTKAIYSMNLDLPSAFTRPLLRMTTDATRELLR